MTEQMREETRSQSPEPQSEQQTPQPETPKTSHYDCKICMAESDEPVVTLCGHLFCWPCIYQWSESRHSETVPCPVCNNSVSVKAVIPLYTSKENHDKRTKDIPKRPQPEQNQFNRNQNVNNNMNFQFHFNGFGFNFGAWNLPNGDRNGMRRWLSIVPVFVFLFAPSLIDLLFRMFFEGPAEHVNLNNREAPRVNFNNYNSYHHAVRFYEDEYADLAELENFGIVSLLTLLFIALTFVLVLKFRRNR